ncbi:PREDICTED: NADH dehydrogenase [ubiquinone] 1 alpha subcomplex subunit 7 [Nipponia nippon]|uniref:NADH dehydrogenase [ubiquinone] 1 alpha subcomplex subunit 7 n=1 Tax=Nipponia nippon TaxID=128390 RepID=UPI000510877D|nr:PREDICTED: NADH dehydrogenase [ubiquinone] 1 alpha subcomplex subunit 7 [Nipponia nippon]
MATATRLVQRFRNFLAGVKGSGSAVTTAEKKPVTPGPAIKKWEISKDQPYL